VCCAPLSVGGNRLGVGFPPAKEKAKDIYSAVVLDFGSGLVLGGGSLCVGALSGPGRCLRGGAPLRGGALAVVGRRRASGLGGRRMAEWLGA
jgi:hypothetical protein